MIDLFAETFESLANNISEHSKNNKKSFEPDAREWKLTRDDNDDGQAIIRLIPDKNGKPYTKMFSHSFNMFSKARNKKLWYIEDSPSTIGMPCPVSEYWAELNAQGTDEAKAEAKTFSRKVSYITNVYIVKDPANPSNEGKVFYWAFGTKLYDKFIATMNPSAKDLAMGEKPVPLWNAMKGANIKLKIKKAAGGFLNYDDTVIMGTTEAFDSKEEATSIITNNTIDLLEFETPAHFKTYEELADKLAFVLGKKDNTVKKEQSIDVGLEDLDEMVVNKPKEQEEKVVEKPAKKVADDVDDGLDFLNDL
jgi:hypothetical protein